MYEPCNQVSNNIAEYIGSLMILQRVVRQDGHHCVLQMDSLLVAVQLNGIWRVLEPDLIPYFRRCRALLRDSRLSGKRIDVVHIYREHNGDADAEANRDADGIHEELNW